VTRCRSFAAREVAALTSTPAPARPSLSVLLVLPSSSMRDRNWKNAAPGSSAVVRERGSSMSRSTALTTIASIVAFLERANQARLAALEVGNGSLQRVGPRLPSGDLATGDVGEVLGQQGTPFGTEQAKREDLQHAAQQHVELPWV
jgi:hypothetical protein